MKYVYTGVAVVIVVFAVFMGVKKVSPVSWGWWGTTNVSSDVALKGHDPVAYFAASEPLAGDPDIAHEWADATWHFSSTENRDLFAANPEKFAPQYGSFCAFAMSKGFTADIAPDAWHIEDGRLYVFADQNVRDEWVAGLAGGTLAASEESWKKR
jgi:hypothetical protein